MWGTEGIMFWIMIKKLRMKFERRVSQCDSSLVQSKDVPLLLSFPLLSSTQVAYVLAMWALQAPESA